MGPSQWPWAGPSADDCPQAGQLRSPLAFASRRLNGRLELGGADAFLAPFPGPGDVRGTTAQPGRGAEPPLNSAAPWVTGSGLVPAEGWPPSRVPPRAAVGARPAADSDERTSEAGNYISQEAPRLAGPRPADLSGAVPRGPEAFRAPPAPPRPPRSPAGFREADPGGPGTGRRRATLAGARGRVARQGPEQSCGRRGGRRVGPSLEGRAWGPSPRLRRDEGAWWPQGKMTRL